MLWKTLQWRVVLWEVVPGYLRRRSCAHLSVRLSLDDPNQHETNTVVWKVPADRMFETGTASVYNTNMCAVGSCEDSVGTDDCASAEVRAPSSLHGNLVRKVFHVRLRSSDYVRRTEQSRTKDAMVTNDQNYIYIIHKEVRIRIVQELYGMSYTQVRK
jgi:hypothetical protein